MIDLEKLIKEQEEKIGRLLTDRERQAIEGMTMIFGAVCSKPEEMKSENEKG